MAKKFLGEEGTDAIINKIKEKSLTDAPVLVRINDIYDPLLEKMPSNTFRKHTTECLDGAKLYECLVDPNNPKPFFVQVQYMTNANVFVTNDFFLIFYTNGAITLHVQFMLSQGNTMFIVRYGGHIRMDHENKVAIIDKTEEIKAQTISLGCTVYPEAYKKPADQQWTEDYWDNKE